jgi:Heterokaryon incompatibility protein (HET)
LTETIILNGCQFKVTPNLEKALQVFNHHREFENDVKLWVDAICINQSDLIERARQIQRMRSIYSSALSVISWLGEEENESERAIKLLHDISQIGVNRGDWLENTLRQNSSYLGRGCWQALLLLMEREYWYRLWIIQEIVMGGLVTIIRCGNSTIDWPSFRDAVTILQEHLWLVKDHLLVDDTNAMNNIQLEHNPVWTTGSLHLVYQDISVLIDSQESGGLHLSFGRILDIANSAACQDPRDKVYSLVGLMNPALAERLKPNYTLDPINVYITTAKTFIEVYGNLEPLREGNPWGPSQTSSWAADWLWSGRLRHSRTENELWGPHWFTSGKRLDTSLYVPYTASGNSSQRVEFSDDGRLLKCKGLVIDQVAGLSARGLGYFDWSKRSIVQEERWKSAYGDKNQTAKALYRVLLSDRVKGGSKAADRHAVIFHLPSTFVIAKRQFERLGWNWLTSQEGYYFRWEEWRKVNKHIWLDHCTLDDFFSDEIPEDASEFDMTEVYTCFDRSSKKRRFMTTEKGYMGWAPDNIFGSNHEQTRAGDLITILYGCSTPLVIRPHGPYFQILGEAYVQGFMDGEAIDDLKTYSFQEQSFTFC